MMRAIDYADERTWFLGRDMSVMEDEHRPLLWPLLQKGGIERMPDPVLSFDFKNEDGEVVLMYDVHSVSLPCAACGSPVWVPRCSITTDKLGRILNYPVLCHACETAEHETRVQAVMNGEDNLRHALANAGVPSRFLDRTFENFDVTEVPESRRTIAALRALAADSPFEEHLMKCAVLIGKTGTGKTHLMTSTLRSYLCLKSHGMPCYTTESSMLDDIKESISQNDVRGRKRQYETAGLLVIDEIGRARKSSEYNVEVFQEILQRRLDHDMPTVVGGNIDPAELVEYLGHQNVSRIAACGNIFQLDADDYRAKHHVL